LKINIYFFEKTFDNLNLWCNLRVVRESEYRKQGEKMNIKQQIKMADGGKAMYIMAKEFINANGGWQEHAEDMPEGSVFTGLGGDEEGEFGGIAAKCRFVGIDGFYYSVTIDGERIASKRPGYNWEPASAADAAADAAREARLAADAAAHARLMAAARRVAAGYHGTRLFAALRRAGLAAAIPYM
jgi:hypothetical protein